MLKRRLARKEHVALTTRKLARYYSIDFFCGDANGAVHVGRPSQRYPDLVRSSLNLSLQHSTYAMRDFLRSCDGRNSQRCHSRHTCSEGIGESRDDVTAHTTALDTFDTFRGGRRGG